MFEEKRKTTRGFTLIEIMIVILIIGILLGVALPSMLQARSKSAEQSCRQNLRMIGVAKERWAMASGHLLHYPLQLGPTSCRYF